MDRYSSKRGVSMSRSPRKVFNAGPRDANSTQDQNAKFCNRIGCSGRIKYENQNMKTGSSEKAKCSRSSFCSLNGNRVIGTSSRSGPTMAKEKSSCLDSKRKLSSQLGVDESQSSQLGDSEATQSMSSPGSSHSRSTKKSGQVPVAKTGSVPSSARSRKENQYTSGSDKQNTQTTSAFSSTSRSSGLGTVNSSRSRRLKNLKRNSISDGAPPSSSSSGSKSPCKNVIKKRSLEGDSSVSGKGKQATAATAFSGNVSSSSGGASTSDYRHSSSTSGADSSVSTSVGTGGSANVNKSRMKLTNLQNGRNTSCLRESVVRISQHPDPEPPRNIGRPRLIHCHSASTSTSGSSSYSLFSSNDDIQSTLMPYPSAEHGYSHLLNHDILQLYNMDGIAEVLLELERIETTHERILALENSLNGFILHDQHRDMRLDIDDMSYEELLALGDRMGTVSTALSEENLLKCIKRRTHQMTPPGVGSTESGEDGDDVKCSICQEDYIEGDEVGELVACQHVYHVGCVEQWLRLKNWCPICKTAAAPPQSSSSS